MRFSLLNRKFHRWAAVFTAPLLPVVILSGVLLQFKKDSSWIQPPTQAGIGETPVIPFSRILEIIEKVPEADIKGWKDIDRLDVRPGKGMVKVRTKNRWEIQIDTETGDILQVAYRRSDLIENIHDGSFFQNWVKLWILFPFALVLLLIWASGIVLFLWPYLKRRPKA